jgi:RHS repeat-associated protein
VDHQGSAGGMNDQAHNPGNGRQAAFDGEGPSGVFDRLNNASTRPIENSGQHLDYSQQWQVIEVHDRWGDTTAQHVWSPVYVDAMVLQDRDTTGDGTLDKRMYVLHDANFNITALVGMIDPLMGGQWDVIERYVYDPYGERTVLDADWSADANGFSDFDFRYGHQGGRHDLTAGLVHFRFRDLYTSLGRWTRQDPTGYVDGANLFLAYTGSPVVYIDSQGLCSLPSPPAPRAFIAECKIECGRTGDIYWGVTTTGAHGNAVACCWCENTPPEGPGVEVCPEPTKPPSCTAPTKRGTNLDPIIRDILMGRQPVATLSNPPRDWIAKYFCATSNWIERCEKKDKPRRQCTIDLNKTRCDYLLGKTDQHPVDFNIPGPGMPQSCKTTPTTQPGGSTPTD